MASKDIATVEKEVLSDFSIAWNVLLHVKVLADEGPRPSVRIGCKDKDMAMALTEELNRSSWVELIY